MEEARVARPGLRGPDRASKMDHHTADAVRCPAARDLYCGGRAWPTARSGRSSHGANRPRRHSQSLLWRVRPSPWKVRMLPARSPQAPRGRAFAIGNGVGSREHRIRVAYCPRGDIAVAGLRIPADKSSEKSTQSRYNRPGRFSTWIFGTQKKMEGGGSRR